MTKTIKNTLTAIFAALILICGALLLLPIYSARADEVTTTGISDGNFAFVPGASVRPSLFSPGVDSSVEDFDLNAATYDLGFYFKLEDPTYKNLADKSMQYRNWWGSRADNVFIYEFTLYAGNRDGDGAGSLGTANPQTSVLIVLYPLDNTGSDRTNVFYGFVAVKDYYGTAGLNDANFLNFKNSVTDNNYSYVLKSEGKTFTVNDVKRTFGGAGYTIVNQGYLADGVSNLEFSDNGTVEGLSTMISLNVISPFSYYFIKARYCFQTTKFVGVFGTSYEQVYGEVYSSSRSVANVLQRMYDAGVDFEDEFGDNATYANAIIRNQSIQRVRIKYLEEIPGTPYATHKYANVDVPVLSETIYITDVEEQLDKNLRKCLDSNAYCFQKATDNDGDFYQLYYLKNVWLRSATIDGNYLDYFLDINDSYKEVYRPYVEAEILTNDIYEWVFSTQMINKFPALADYRFNEIYGYFGLVVIPESYSLNSALKTMFDVNTSKIGVISNFVFERTLSYEGYQSLLSEYNYGFLRKAWAEVAGFVAGAEHNARYYLIYSEPGTENALIGEGGQTDAEDPGSIAGNAVQGIAKEIGGVVSNVWNGITGFFNTLSSGTQVLLWIALIGAAVVLGVVVHRKINNSGNGRRRK